MTFVDRVCGFCAKPFIVKASQAAIPGYGRFCSLSCARSGPNGSTWKGGKTIAPDGYVFVNEKAIKGDRKTLREHVFVAERALGKRLPLKAHVHHFNENRSDNRNQNLVICQDMAYHALLHQLNRVRLAGGRPFLDVICCTCRLVKPKTEFTTNSGRCKTCCAAAQRAMRRQKQSGAAA